MARRVPFVRACAMIALADTMRPGLPLLRARQPLAHGDLTAARLPFPAVFRSSQSTSQTRFGAFTGPQFVDRPEVARVQPPVHDRPRGLLGTIEIAAEQRAGGHDLADLP